MSGISNIEWTDRVWNPVTGCDKVSPGCKFCYAEVIANRFWHKQYDEVPTGRHNAEQNGPETRPRRFTDVLTHEDRLLDPLSWKKPQRVFVNSMSDLFHAGVPDTFIDRAFNVMARASQHTFQILTKRPARMRAYVSAGSGFEALQVVGRWPLPNVWLGVSAEDQQRADERIPLLLQTPAAVHFVSAEPLLGPIDLQRIPYKNFVQPGNTMHGADGLARNALEVVPGGHPPLDWVIVGGESGPKARPCHLDWIRGLVEQCQRADVPIFVKQIGSRAVDYSGTFQADLEISKLKTIFKDSKGGSPSEWPPSLRVREFPGAAQ